jgi:hypothetical protein
MRKPSTHFEQISLKLVKKVVARQVSKNVSPGIAAFGGKPIAGTIEPDRLPARASKTRTEPTRRARAMRESTPIKDA